MRRPGFTLIELVVTMGITVIIFSIVAAALNAVLSTSRLRTGQAQQIGQATRILDYVVHTIREAQPSPTGAYPIVDATSSSLTFFSTISGTTVVRVRFFQTGTTLQQGIIQPVGTPATYPVVNEVVTTILTNIKSASTSLFSYYPDTYAGSGAAMSPINLLNVRLVNLQLQFDPDAFRLPGPMTISLNAELRNLKENY